MLARGDIFPVRTPGRIVEEGELLLGQLAPVGAVRVHDPDIVAAAAIRREGDLAAVGRKAGLHFIRYAGGDAGRRAARDRDGRSEEHTSELQSLMRMSYAAICWKKKNKKQNIET